MTESKSTEKYPAAESTKDDGHTIALSEPKPATKPRTRGKAKPKAEAKAKDVDKREGVTENFVVLVDDNGIATIAPINWVGPPQMRFPATRIAELHGLLGSFLDA